MLLQSYTDSYEKLTEKTFSGIRWAYYNCILIQYIMIADDDVYIKTKQLIPEIKMMDVTNSIGMGHEPDEHENRQISSIECIAGSAFVQKTRCTSCTTHERARTCTNEAIFVQNGPFKNFKNRFIRKI